MIYPTIAATFCPEVKSTDHFKRFELMRNRSFPVENHYNFNT